MNSKILKGKFQEHGMTQGEVARKIGISLSRFNAKLNGTGGAEFSLGEALALKQMFSLTPEQMEAIFF